LSAAEPSITVVNVVAVSYSGSTWVNLLLGSHPEAFSIGEMDKIQKFGEASCRLHGTDCPIWKQFDLKSSENPYLQIARITGKRVLIVNNTLHYLEAQDHPRIKRRFIWLIRDGRAVVASTLRKYPEKSTWAASRGWARAIVKKQQLIESRPAEETLTVSYEKAAADAETYAKQFCEHIGIAYDAQMLEYWKSDQHFIGGNPGTMTDLAERKETAPVERRKLDDSQIGAEHYRGNDPTHFVDERWKQELSNWQLRVFGLAAGRRNRSYGYPPSLDRG
jgi:hypothetical protein